MKRARSVNAIVLLSAASILVAAVLAALAVALPRHASQAAQASRTAGSHTTWRRVLFDNFSHRLSARRWGTYSGVPGGDPSGLWAASHVVVSKGVLNLESFRDPRFGGRWVSGGVSSAPALSQTYGKYEVRLRMDAGRGVAFVALLWPSGDRWPPEIDFAENGGETNGRDHMTATLHYGGDDSQIQRTVRGDFTRWHVLGVEWTPGSLVYTLDSRPWAVIRTRAVPASPMELDLQAQTGTCGDHFAPCPDASTPKRVDAQIDWVAAYSYRRN